MEYELLWYVTVAIFFESFDFSLQQQLLTSPTTLIQTVEY